MITIYLSVYVLCVAVCCFRFVSVLFSSVYNFLYIYIDVHIQCVIFWVFFIYVFYIVHLNAAERKILYYYILDIYIRIIYICMRARYGHCGHCNSYLCKMSSVRDWYAHKYSLTNRLTEMCFESHFHSTSIFFFLSISFEMNDAQQHTWNVWNVLVFAVMFSLKQRVAFTFGFVVLFFFLDRGVFLFCLVFLCYIDIYMVGVGVRQ